MTFFTTGNFGRLPEENRLSGKNRYALVTAAQVYNENEVDVISVVKTLKDCEFITSEMYERLFTEVSRFNGNSKERIVHLNIAVSKLTDLSFEDFICFLFAFDFKFAKKFTEYVVLTRSGLYLEIGRAILPNENQRTELFISVKGDLDRHIIDAEDLLNAADFELNKFRTGTDKQKALDNFAIYSCLRVQQSSEDAEKEQILDQMHNAITPDVDITFVETLYHCKMARVTKSEFHKQRALAICQNFYDQFLWAFVALDIMHVLREEYSVVGNAIQIDKIIDQCVFGLKGANKSVFLKRLILLNLALTYLRINDRLSVNVYHGLSKLNRQCAKQILTQIKDNLFEDIEPRRRMMFNLAMARAVDDEENDQAITFAEEAKNLASASSFFVTEERNIADYLRVLYSRPVRSVEERLNLLQPAL